MSLIQFLPAPRHIRRIDNLPGRLVSHTAILKDETGRQFTAVVTAFPPNSNGVINAVHGYAYHKECGLPVPPRAFVIVVPMLKLRSYHPGVEWLQECADPRRVCWAYELPADALPECHVRVMDGLLCGSVDLPGYVALREALHDLEADSLSFAPMVGSELMAVDFSECLGGQFADLDNIHTLRPKRSSIAVRYWLRTTTDTTILRERGRIHQQAHRRADHELRLIRNLLIRSSGARAAVSAFLNERMSQEWTQRRWER